MSALLTVSDLTLGPAHRSLRGRFIDLPKRGATIEAQATDILGWVLPTEAPATSVEVEADGIHVARVPLLHPRPDLAAAFPDIPWAASGGFRTTLDLIGRRPTAQVVLRAALADGRRVEIGRFEAARRWREHDVAGPEALVSVVIPCYGQAMFLSEAIESVRQQTHRQVEVVVVDDGSYDNTAAVAARFPGVGYVRQENQGLAAARNTGIRHTNGDFLVFLDADDRLLPHALEHGLARLAERPDAAFTSGCYRYVDAEGDALPTPDQPRPQGDGYAALLRHNCGGMPAVGMYRRAVFHHVRGFDTSVDAVADYDLHLRVARCFPVAWHGETVAEYRQHSGAMSRDPALMLRSVLRVHRSQRSHLGTDAQLRAAHAEGERFWRQRYGPPAADDLRRRLARRDADGILSDALVLLRCDPAALARAVRGPRR